MNDGSERVLGWKQAILSFIMLVGLIGWLGPTIYDMDPVAILAGKGAEIIINLSASPFFAGKDAIRYHLIQKHVRRHGTAFFLVNQVGGNDELLFDGKSLVLDPEGRLIHLSPAFSAETSTVDMVTPEIGLFDEPTKPAM